ncbi:hypothetical protein [Catellatospora methionotrophica]|uniref:hypothetical protein n=1 Tax=Catellatospora methionotrophica TaxID=121620 RepID=UPI00140A6ED0|nr:hypothetical protein [Catellatospora methionotrophica]
MKPVIGSPLDRLLTVSLLLSLALTAVSSVCYALSGWNDSTGAVLHILGAALGPLMILRVATYLDGAPLLATVALAVGVVGSAGVVGYGFNTIEVALGGIDLVDATGAAVIIKPLGLCWPLGLLLLGVGLLRTGSVPRAYAAGLVLASVVFPVSRIANIAWLAVAVDVVLLVSLAAAAFGERAASRAAGATPPVTAVSG